MRLVKKMILVVSLVVWLGSVAIAGMTTEQFWGFDDDTSPPPGVVADSYTNPAGEPIWTNLYLADPNYMQWSWEDMAGSPLRGMWGGMTFNISSNDVAVGMDFEVPVPAGDDSLTFQSIFWADKFDPASVVVLEVSIEGVSVTEDSRTISDCLYEGGTGGWFMITADYSWAAQDEDKVAQISFDILKGNSMAVMIESVGLPVIPEPMTMTVLIFGASLMLLRKRGTTGE